MILPILITDRWVSIVDIDSEDIKNLSSYIYKIPFRNNSLEADITLKKLGELFEFEFKKFADKKDLKKIISLNELSDISIDYKLAEIIEKAKFQIILPDLEYSQSIDKLTPDRQNLCANYLYYKADLPLELRILLDLYVISASLKSHPGLLINSEYIVIGTPGLSEEDKTKYIKYVLPIIAESIPIAGIWKIIFDSNLSVVPTLAYLIENELDIKEYMDKDVFETDIKLIIAPGVNQIEVDGFGQSKNVDLKPNQLNTFKLGLDKSINMKWKSKNSKFEGEIFGSKFGVKIDNRERQ